MATYTESFNKADGAPLGPDLTWTQVSGGTWQVTANQASPSGASHGDVAYARAEHDTATSDMYAQFVVTELPAALDQGGPCARFQSAANTSYMAMVGGSPLAVTLRKTVNGTRTNLSSAVGVAGPLPKLLRTEISGSTLTGFWDGAQVVQVTDTSIPAGTRAGLYSDEASGNFIVDSFEFGDLSGATDITPGSATHGHTADEPVLTQVHILAPDSALHSHTADQPTLSSVGDITPEDALHGHAAGQPNITQIHMITVDDALHAHTAGQPTVIEPSDTLANLDVIALAPVFGHGPMTVEMLERQAAAPVMVERTALAPAMLDREAGDPVLGHGDTAAQVGHGNTEVTLGHGKAGEPTT